MGITGADDLLLHMIKFWRACAVDEDNRAITMVLYYSGMMYKYYYHLRFNPIKIN